MGNEQIKRLNVGRTIDLIAVLVLYLKSFVTVDGLIHSWLRNGVPISGLDLGTCMLFMWLCYRVFFEYQSGD